MSDCGRWCSTSTAFIVCFMTVWTLGCIGVFIRGTPFGIYWINGFGKTVGTVSEQPSWIICSDDGAAGAYQSHVKFNFLGNVITSTVNGTTSYKFVGGHYCTVIGDCTTNPTSYVEEYFENHAQVGMTHPLFFKHYRFSSDEYFCILSTAQMSWNYGWAVFVFLIVSPCWCGFLFTIGYALRTRFKILLDCFRIIPIWFSADRDMDEYKPIKQSVELPETSNLCTNETPQTCEEAYGAVENA